MSARGLDGLDRRGGVGLDRLDRRGGVGLDRLDRRGGVGLDRLDRRGGVGLDGLDRRDARDERGSMAVEMVVLIPVLFVFTLFVVAGGRYVNVQGDADSTARDAARAASLTRTPAEAQAAVQEAIREGLQSTRSCKADSIDLSNFRSGFDNGQYANGVAKVRLQCSVSLADLGLLGIGKTITFDADGHAPVDTFRRTG